MVHDEEDLNNDGVSPELMEQFEQWSKSDVSLGGAIPLEEEPDKAFLLVQARRSRKIRFFAFLIVAFLSAYGITNTLGDTQYYFQDSAPTELGDLRENYVSGKRSLDVSPNAYVKAENMVMVLPADDQGGQYRFFFCPLYNIIVRTEQEIIIPRDKVFLELTGTDEKIINSKPKPAEALDLVSKLDVAGRLVPLPDAPEQFRRAWERTYGPALDGRGLKPEDIYVIIDGQIPGEDPIYPISALLSILFVLVSAFFFWRSVQTEKKLAMQFNKASTEEG